MNEPHMCTICSDEEPGGPGGEISLAKFNLFNRGTMIRGSTQQQRAVGRPLDCRPRSYCSGCRKAPHSLCPRLDQLPAKAPIEMLLLEAAKRAVV